MDRRPLWWNRRDAGRSGGVVDRLDLAPQDPGPPRSQHSRAVDIGDSGYAVGKS